MVSCLEDGLSVAKVSENASEQRLQRKGFGSAGWRSGGCQQKAARGLRKMRNRAARCGAELELVFRAGGTRLRLELPRCVPDSDAAAG